MSVICIFFFVIWWFAYLVKKLHVFYGTRKFNTVFTGAHYFLCKEPDESTLHLHNFRKVRSLRIRNSFRNLQLTRVSEEYTAPAVELFSGVEEWDSAGNTVSIFIPFIRYPSSRVSRDLSYDQPSLPTRNYTTSRDVWNCLDRTSVPQWGMHISCLTLRSHGSSVFKM